MFKNLESKKFDPHFDLFDGEYPIEFQYQLRKGIRLLVDKYVNYQERQLYYVDNIGKIEPKHLKRLQQAIQEKNNEWIRDFRIKEINSRDKL